MNSRAKQALAAMQRLENEHGGPPEPGGPITALKLRWIALYCDVMDAITGMEGEDVQADLRRWAHELDQGKVPL